jgi:hypothetical protein
MGEWSTEVKPSRKSNPRGWVVTDHARVLLNPSNDILNKFKVIGVLHYDKDDVSFNVNSGGYLLFNDKGCFILEQA